MPRIATRDEILTELGTVRPLPSSRLKELLSLQSVLFSEAERHRHLGWRAAGGEAHKAKISLTQSQLQSFGAHWFGGIGFEFGFDFQMHAHEMVPIGTPFSPPMDRSSAYRDAVKSRLILETDRIRRWAPELEPQWNALLQEAAAIGGLALRINNESFPFQVAHHGIRVAYRAPVLAAWTETPPERLLEIGGGHGRFIRDCALLMPETRLILTDLPLNLMLSARYLEEYFGDAVNLCMTAGQEFAPQARINIVAPWRLDEIVGAVDATANFLSFHHMDTENLTYYGDAMGRLGVRTLFQINRDVPREGHDLGIEDYPFASDFETVREDVAGISKHKMVGSDEVTSQSRQIIRLSRRTSDA